MDLTISPYIIWIIYFTIGERNVAHVLMTIWFSSQVPCGAGTKIPSKMCSCANRGLISPIITHLTRDICSRFQVWNIYQHLARKSLKCRYSKYTIHGASHWYCIYNGSDHITLYHLDHIFHDRRTQRSARPDDDLILFSSPLRRWHQDTFEDVFLCKPWFNLTHHHPSD